MSNPKDCIHCYDYEDMGCKMPVCEFDFPSIDIPKCNDCSKYIKRDLVQVVRCKDCRFFEDEDYYGNCYCEEWGNITNANGYCHDAERRTDEAN